MRSGESGFFDNVLKLLRTPVMIGAVIVGGLGVAMHGFVELAKDHKSGEMICIEAGGSWDNTFGNCEMPPVRSAG